MTIYFNHRVGDGVHYVTKHRGDSSENCILYNLFILALRHRIGALNVLWNQVYPEDYMSEEDMAYIVASALPITEPFDPASPDNIRDILSDVRVIKCFELADLIEQLLHSRGLVF